MPDNNDNNIAIFVAIILTALSNMVIAYTESDDASKIMDHRFADLIERIATRTITFRREIEQTRVFYDVTIKNQREWIIRNRKFIENLDRRLAIIETEVKNLKEGYGRQSGPSGQSGAPSEEGVGPGTAGADQGEYKPGFRSFRGRHWVFTGRARESCSGFDRRISAQGKAP